MKTPPIPKTQRSDDKKLFPIHPPLTHVDLELENVHAMFGDMRRVVEHAYGDMEEHWLVALEAMAIEGERRAEQTLKMLHAAQRLAKADA